MREEEIFLTANGWLVCQLLCEVGFQKEGRMVRAKNLKGCYIIFWSLQNTQSQTELLPGP